MESHLLRMRGLKQTKEVRESQRAYVASFTDAWIETCRESGWRASAGVASFTDVWVETSIRLISQTAQGVRPLRI